MSNLAQTKWRTIIHVIARDATASWMVIPSWNPRLAIRREGYDFQPGTRFFAQVNIGAESADDLEIDGVEVAEEECEPSQPLNQASIDLINSIVRARAPEDRYLRADDEGVRTSDAPLVGNAAMAQENARLKAENERLIVERDTEARLRRELKIIAQMGLSDMGAFADVMIEDKRRLIAEVERLGLRVDLMSAEISKADDENERLRAALQAIIDECPNPKLPYGYRVVEIARKALKEG